MSWEHELAMRIKAQGKTGGIETGYLVGHVISPKWSEADEAWTVGELIISTLEGQAMLTEGMLDRLDAGGELHDGMTVALIPGARALRGGQRFFVAEIPGHGALPGRDSPDCHPIEAITGLREELDDHDDRLDHLETIRIPALEHDMNEAGGRVPVLEGRVEALEDLESALGEDLSDLSDRVDDIVTHGGEPNVIETVKRNGVALPVTGKAVDVSVPTKVSQLTNDSGYISQETDPTVPAWAKAATKPSYTAQEVGAAEAGHTHPYLPLTGGTLKANLTIRRDAGTTSLILDSPEKTDVGRARTQLQKNASASSDNGTNLVDYVWGDGSTATQRVNLRLQASAAQLRDRLRLVDYPDGASGTTYRIYGDHNPPTIANITGLEARLAAIEARLTALEGG